ncbi:dehydrogenase/reductase SDR family member 7C-B-like [Aulostomus maculatus]
MESNVTETQNFGCFLKGGKADPREELAEDLVSASDPGMTFPPKMVSLDFGDMESLPEAAAEILECYGVLVVVLLNSTLKVRAPAQSLSLDVDKLLMHSNDFGPVTLAKGVLPSTLSWRTGHLLLVNSIQGKPPLPFRTSYAASRHAVQAFFECLRAEVEDFGVSVSTINHTFISNCAAPPPEAALPPSVWSHQEYRRNTNTSVRSQCSLDIRKPVGVSPDDAATEVAKTLKIKRKEVCFARQNGRLRCDVCRGEGRHRCPGDVAPLAYSDIHDAGIRR